MVRNIQDSESRIVDPIEKYLLYISQAKEYRFVEKLCLSKQRSPLHSGHLGVFISTRLLSFYHIDIVYYFIVIRTFVTK